MKSKEISEKAPTLEGVRQQFEDWRKTRIKREMIPTHLWEAAIALSNNHSVSQISQALRLNYSDLKKRIERMHSTHLPETIGPKFIGFEISNRQSIEYIIEMAHQNGAAMKVHIKGSHIDVVELSKNFWSAG